MHDTSICEGPNTLLMRVTYKAMAAIFFWISTIVNSNYCLLSPVVNNETNHTHISEALKDDVLTIRTASLVLYLLRLNFAALEQESIQDIHSAVHNVPESQVILTHSQRDKRPVQG